MTLTAILALVACIPAALGQAVPVVSPSPTFVKPSLGPTQANSTNYVGASNGTIINSPLVPGKMFDRFITIMMENTDYSTAAASPVFQKLAKKGILYTDYYAITHPSMPNYIASVSGSTQGAIFDDTSDHVFPNAPANIKTIVDLLEAKDISWATYMENMPEVGYTELAYSSHNYNNPGAVDYEYYVRRHSPLMKFDSITQNPARLDRHRNFNNFAEDLNNNALPQWIWITPNIVNDAHNSDIDYVSSWLDYFLVPLLDDPNFNNNRTYITLTWDECEVGTDDVNQIYVLGLGQTVPESLHGTEDGEYYNHYSQLATVEDNWDLGNLGQGDVAANVYTFLAQGLDHDNTDPQPLEPGIGPYLEPNNGVEPGPVT